MDPNEKIEPARVQITEYLKKKGKALLTEITADTGLQKELVSHVLTKFLNEFEWSIRPGVFEKEYFLKK